MEKIVAFDKYTEDLIDYVDLGDIELNYSTFQNVNDLAIHAVVWEALAVLELTFKLQVMATVCDGASPNRKFYWMHEHMSNADDSKVVSRIINLYSPG